MEPEPLLRAKALASQGRHADALALALPLAQARGGDLHVQMTAGFLARDAGAFDEALECFDRALSIQPGNPQIGNIRANTLAAAGRADEALSAFAALLALHPDFLEAHLNRAITAQEAGHDGALGWVEQSLTRFPGAARLWSVKGEILRDLDRQEEALEAARRATSLEPSRPLHQMRLGVALRRLERHSEALEAYQAAERLGTAGPVLQATKAAVLLELDRVDEAEALYREAFAGGDREAGLALLRLRLEYRGDRDPASHLAKAARDSGTAERWLEWLNALASFREFDKLASATSEATVIFPDDPRVQRLAAVSRASTGDPAGAFAALTALQTRSERPEELDRDLAYVALALRDGMTAERHAEAMLAQDPHDQAALAFLATAWRLMDDPREFWLCDYERFIVPVEVPGPAGQAPGDFARLVAATLEPLHRTKAAPGDQSLRSGTQTSGRLFARQEPGIREFQQGLEAAIRRVLMELPDDPGHPFLSRKSAAFRWTGSWSVRLTGGAGRHVAHFHSEGWMSSAYYARLPASLGDGASTEGWIAFGAPPEDLNLDLAPRREVRPEEGMLVLFPSYMWHNTQPFSGPETRLTAAFDIVPVA